MTQKSEQKDKSHGAIVASAAALMRARGIAATSVADVMKGAKLTVGGFYNHFESKEALFESTIRHTANTLWNRLLARADAAPTRREKARVVIGRYASRSHRDAPETGCLLPAVVPEVARDGGDYRDALGAEFRQFVDAFATLLGESRVVALGLIAMMYGGLSLARAFAGTKLSDEMLDAVNEVGDLVLDAAKIK